MPRVKQVTKAYGGGTAYAVGVSAMNINSWKQKRYGSGSIETVVISSRFGVRA